MQINYDTWNGNRNEGNSIIINSNEKQKLSDLLKRLDQKTYTQLIFDGDEIFLIVGGGNGNYICTLTIEQHEDFYNLVSSNSEEDEVDVVTGGQPGTFAGNLINNFDDTLKAIEYYVQYQRMNPDLHWENK